MIITAKSGVKLEIPDGAVLQDKVILRIRLPSLNALIITTGYLVLTFVLNDVQEINGPEDI